MRPQAAKSGWQTQCAMLLRLQTEMKNESNKERKIHINKRERKRNAKGYRNCRFSDTCSCNSESSFQQCRVHKHYVEIETGVRKVLFYIAFHPLNARNIFNNFLIYSFLCNNSINPILYKRKSKIVQYKSVTHKYI